MRIDLEQLKAIHPRLPRTTAQEYVHRAALALQRRHAPGVEMAVTSGEERTVVTLAWSPRSNVGAEVLDGHRVTEDAAEAVAQVAMSSSAELRAACVVRFREPITALQLLPEVSS